MKAFSKNTYNFGLLFVCLIPWAIIQIDLRIPGDVAFLYSSMHMLLEGKMMSEYFYDTNPPMSFLIYSPAILLHKLGFSDHVSIQLYTMSLTTVSVFFMYYFLSKWKTLDTTSLFIILSSYIGAVTLLAHHEYAQKDHLIAIAIIPFLLMQLSLTNNHKIATYIIWITTILYVPFILLKPHFGLLPAALILHRLYYNKSLAPLMNADFIGLALGTILYIFFIHLVTPDFMSEILPSSLPYYFASSVVPSIHKNALIFLLVAFFLIALSKLSDDTTDTKKICIAFAALVMLSVIPFWVQNKGYSLHLYPTLCLMSITLFLTISLYIKNKFITLYSKPYIFIFLIFALFYLHTATDTKTMSKAEYKNSSLAVLLEEKAGDKPFFMETYTTNIIMTQAFYSRNPFASRFPSLWFFAFTGEMKEQEKQAMWKKYGTMIMQDIERHQPAFIAFLKPENTESGLLNLLENIPNSKEQLQNYSYDTDFIISQDSYSDFLFQEDNADIVYNIYIRK